MKKAKIEPKYPEINWLRAAIIDRKNSLDYTWDELGEAVGTSGDALKHLIHSQPDPWEWKRTTREKVCHVLGIEIRQFVVGSPENIAEAKA